MFKKLLFLMIAFGLTSVLTACEQEGPAERAGEKIDETVEQAQEKAEEAMGQSGETEQQQGTGEAAEEKNQ